MKLILAIKDRDLLESVKKLLLLEGHTVTAVFDGVQALTHIANEKYAAAVLDSDLTRVKTDDLINILAESRTPAIILSAGNNTKYSAAVRLEYPFLPEELFSALEAVKEKSTTTEGEVL